MKCNCPYYQVDIQAQKEAEQMEPPFFSDPPDADPDPASLPEEKNALAKCGAFCKYLNAGRGFPGEYVYYCSAPGNRHIIHVDFNETEII